MTCSFPVSKINCFFFITTGRVYLVQTYLSVFLVSPNACSTVVSHDPDFTSDGDVRTVQHKHDHYCGGNFKKIYDKVFFWANFCEVT